LPSNPPLLTRLIMLGDEICGGFQDGSDNLLAFLGVIAVLLFARRAGGLARGSLERALALACAANFALYLVLPQHTETAKLIHFRHAVLAFSLLPLVVSRLPSGRLLRAAPWLVYALVLVNAWSQLRAFDREARDFDRIVARAPRDSRMVQLNYDAESEVVKPLAYLHFVAFIQARKGGFVTMSFPERFWNLPVKLRPEAGVPATPIGFEWDPRWWDEARFGWFYEWALLSLPKGQLEPSRAFPFRRVAREGRWQLYRRVSTP
jgi:hypothetical protein